MNSHSIESRVFCYSSMFIPHLHIKAKAKGPKQASRCGNAAHPRKAVAPCIPVDRCWASLGFGFSEGLVSFTLILLLFGVIYGDNGKENGNYYSILGLYWDIIIGILIVVVTILITTTLFVISTPP